MKLYLICNNHSCSPDYVLSTRPPLKRSRDGNKVPKIYPPRVVSPACASLLAGRKLDPERPEDEVVVIESAEVRPTVRILGGSIGRSEVRP